MFRGKLEPGESASESKSENYWRRVEIEKRELELLTWLPMIQVKTTTILKSQLHSATLLELRIVQSDSAHQNYLAVSALHAGECLV